MKLIITIIMIMLYSYIPAEEVIDYIVAKVGREVILRSDFERQKAQMKQIGLLTDDLTDEEIINDMIESRLILTTARERNYRLDDHRIRQMVENQINHQISQFGSETVLREELRKAGMSLSDLRDYYEQMIREQRLKEMIIEREITSRIHVTDAEIEEFYYDNQQELPLRPEKVEIGLISRDIKASDRTKRRVLAEINRIYDKLREGEDFGELARSQSDCPSRELRGDLGFFGRGMMIKEFEEAAFALKAGEISRVVETQFGYHIIKMEEKDEDEIRVRHILKRVEPSEDDVQEVVNLMDEVLLKLRNGQNFSRLAETYSDNELAGEGGIIGEFSEEEYPEMFKPYLMNIDIGEFTNVIREGETLYIFGKLRKVEERPFRLEEVREELKDYLHTLKQIDHYERWISNLRDESFVEIYIN